MPDDPVDVIWEVATDDRFTLARRARASPPRSPTRPLRPRRRRPASTRPPTTTTGSRWASGRARPAAPARCRVRRARPVPPRRRQLPVVRHRPRTPPTGTWPTRTSTSSLHLGDYVYEYRLRPAVPPARDVSRRSPTSGCATRSYSSTRPPGRPRRFPFVLHLGRPRGGQQLHGRRARRRAPTRAPPEPQGRRLPGLVGEPADPAPRPTGPTCRSYQHLDVGDLARIYVLDERQYADAPPCRDDEASDDFGDCARAPTRTAPAWARPRRSGSPRPPGHGRHGLEPRRQPGRAGRHRRRHATTARVLPRHLGRLPRRPASG